MVDEQVEMLELLLDGRVRLTAGAACTYEDRGGRTGGHRAGVEGRSDAEEGSRDDRLAQRGRNAAL